MLWFTLLLAGAALCSVAVAQSDEATNTPDKLIAANDLDKLKLNLLAIKLVPTPEDELAIGSGQGNTTYKEWVAGIADKLKKAYELGNINNKLKDDSEPSVSIAQVDLTTLENSKTVKVSFVVTVPPKGPVKGEQAQLVYATLTKEQLWKAMDRECLSFPVAQYEVAEGGATRTFSIIAFVLGWVCLAALITLVAYLGIKYRDGIKSLARRIETWSNPHRTGYSNLGGDTPSTQTWADTPAGETRGLYTEERPKKKLRPPGGLLTDIDDTDTEGYGTYQETPSVEQLPPMEMRVKDLAAGPVKLADLTMEEGRNTPPMSPTSMQRHLIKKYQEKQAEGELPVSTDTLKASASEVFSEQGDFADCVDIEEEEVFNVEP